MASRTGNGRAAAANAKVDMHSVGHGYDLDLRGPSLETTLGLADVTRGTPAPALGATARLAAAALGAPLGVVWQASGGRVATSGPFGPPDVGPREGSASWRRLFARLQEHASGPLMLPDLSRHQALAGLLDPDLERLVTFAGSPIRHRSGGVLGWVAVLDTVRREWTPGDRELLDGIVGLTRSAVTGPGSSSSVPVDTVAPASITHSTAASTVTPTAAPDIVRLADAVAQSLTVASDGVAGLVHHASEHEDPVLQRHAGVADRHLEVLRAQATRLRSSLAGHAALQSDVTLFDLGRTVRAAVREAATTLGVLEPSCTVPDGPLPVSGNSGAVKRALVQLLSGVLVVAAPESVAVGLQTEATVTERLEGRLMAELRITARGVSLSVAELSRAVAGALARESGVVNGPKAVRLSVAGSDIRLDGPGLRAWTSTTSTTVALRWPVDLG